MKSHLEVKQTASTIGQVEAHRKVLRGLGLRGIGSHVTVANTPSFRGMVKKVLHLVDVTESDAPAAGKK
jgi:large subunit ribosomal protein L30